MTSWKNTFLISRSLYGNNKILPEGNFLYYTCHNVNGHHKLLFSRYLTNFEIKSARSIIEGWFNDNSLLSHSDMSTFGLKSIACQGGILIIQITFNGLTRSEKESLLINFWNTSYHNMDKLDKYEILYFQAYPSTDSIPLYWDLKSFEKQQHFMSFSYIDDTDDTSKNPVWIHIPHTNELFEKLKSEALKTTPTYITHDDYTYYFDIIKDHVVCYFYADKNPECMVRPKIYSIHKSYVPPQLPSKKYIWLTHLPECHTN
jgi:hypothetical protein